MKKCTIYKCERCGSTYPTAEGATQCEESHIKPKSIFDMQYSRGEQYPGSIRIRFMDGKDVFYNKGGVIK